MAMPGFGSLVAGRVSGYAQAALAIGGMILTTIFGVRFIWWYVANWSRFHEPESDPAAALSEMWPFLKWPLLGFGMFAVGWLWGLAAGLQIVSSAKNAESATVPPRLS